MQNPGIADFRDIARERRCVSAPEVADDGKWRNQPDTTLAYIDQVANAQRQTA